MEYREVAEEAGITHWRRVPALNTDGAFIAELASLVGEAIASPSMSVSEVCVSNNCDLTEGPGALLGLMPGVTNDAETVNGRAAMVGLIGTFFLELFSGRDLMHVLGGAVPEERKDPRYARCRRAPMRVPVLSPRARCPGC